jgi:uncharacterized protein YndB with AHSA1/START domain
MIAKTVETTKKGGRVQSKIHLEQSYPHPRAKLWRALTEPPLMEKWGMRPEGFAPVVGTKFKLVEAKPRGWRGFVECEVLAVEPERLLKITWVGDEKDPPQTVTYALRDDGTGSRLTLDHEGFVGIGGFIVSKLFLRPGWKAMLSKKIAEVVGGAA